MNTRTISDILNGNTYPGRGIILGRSEDGLRAVLAYFIMGRSVNSRNRIFTETEDGIRTEAFDPSQMTDPSLIIYHPVRFCSEGAVVTNGDQTDTIRNAMEAGGTFREALLTREFEPDPPNFTPRISGVVYPGGRIALSILKSLDGKPDCCCRYFYEYEKPAPGIGYFIHTYEGDGAPIPSFEGEPRRVAITCGYRQFAEEIWNALNEDNRVSLYACEIELATGRRAEPVIINKNQK